ncbi:putative Ig domain-containing protein [Delftia tsuruhatensis]|uniref:putative Ig domain-containing protein n=1 Tax=Delftia tsuruhatensis TaxID=180282 RepID=UPI001E763D19|nr:putative Ig domain-containing protein [Delftia tsuruhatensis]CAC9688179.1 Putative Ig domain [Delftia tsuruhatensis]
MTASSLPAGLSLSSGGVISGTPTAAGTFNFTATATDSSTGTGPFTGQRAYTLTVNAPTISVAPASLGTVLAGAAVSGTLTASGGTSSYSFAVTSGSLPPGVSLSSGGALSGKATATGTYNFTITATDSSTGTGPFSGSRAYSWTINAPAMTANPVSGSNLSGSAMAAFSQSFMPSGGNGPYSYGIVINSGSMPSGLIFSTATGTLSGTPTAGGHGDLHGHGHRCDHGAGAPFMVSGTYNLTVGAPTVVVAPEGGIASPAIGTAYSLTFTASGTAVPYSFRSALAPCPRA